MSENIDQCGNRDPVVDSWRGVLILFVVLGHVVGMAEHFCDSSAKTFLEAIYKLIYVFHMPAFFCLAGLTWRHGEDELFVSFLAKKAKRLLIPYFVFGLLSALVYYLMQGAFYSSINGRHDGYYASIQQCHITTLLLSLIHAGGWPESGVFRANSVLWFLPALFSAEVIFWVIERLIKRKFLRYIAICVLYIGGFYVSLEHLPWGLSRSLNLIVFLAAGRWLGGVLKIKCRVWVYAIFAGVYLLACIGSPNHWIVHKSVCWYVVFALFAMAGIFLSYKIAVRVKGFAAFITLGMSAMGVMLVHKFFIVAMQAKIPFFARMCRHGIISSSLSVIVATVFVAISSVAVSKVIARVSPWALGMFNNCSKR